jgi:hypothetical protein
MAPCLRASAFVLEIDGFLASMMMAAISTLGSLAQSRYPRSIHPTVISGRQVARASREHGALPWRPALCRCGEPHEDGARMPGTFASARSRSYARS